MITQFSKKKGNFCLRGVHFFLRLLKHTVLHQPTVDTGGDEGMLLWLLAVGCWHFNDTSMALQWHFNGTLTAL